LYFNDSKREQIQEEVEGWKDAERRTREVRKRRRKRRESEAWRSFPRF